MKKIYWLIWIKSLRIYTSGKAWSSSSKMSLKTWLSSVLSLCLLWHQLHLKLALFFSPGWLPWLCASLLVSPLRNDFLLCFQQASWNSFSSGQCLLWDRSLTCRQEDHSGRLSQGSTSGAFPEPSWWEPAGKCARNEFWERTTIAMPCLPHHLLYSSVFSACFDNQESQDGLWVESVKVRSSFC